MAKILMSIGPIPAKLDSVKYLTNRFKGGLAYKTALDLQEKYGHDVTIIKWKYAEPKESPLNIINIEDILDYKDKVLGFEADCYILAAAVANLMPSNPWEGKFPSHEYKVGEQFNIKFEIAPRIIDEIKKKYPRSSLIGYKLFDGSDEELVDAGFETLINSKSNIVFANHPSWAKEKKIMLTQDGSEIDVTFDEHTMMIDKLVNAAYYKTEVEHKTIKLMATFSNKINLLLNNYPKCAKNGQTFGSFAHRFLGGFVTTTRGKKEKDVTFVRDINHKDKTIKVNKVKATLNAPTFDIILKKNPFINILIHGHKSIAGALTTGYTFPGTHTEVEKFANIVFTKKDNVINIENHGYIAGFEDMKACLTWIKKNYNRITIL